MKTAKDAYFESLPGLDDTNHQELDYQEIEIFISCRDLKNMDILSLSDPFVKIYEKKGEKNILICETEIVKNSLNPNFVKTARLKYKFEEKQILFIEVLDKDKKAKIDVEGYVTTTVGDLMGTKNQTAIYDIVKNKKVNGKLVLRAEIIKGKKNTARISFQGRNLKLNNGFLSKHEPFFQLSRIIGGHHTIVFESDFAESDPNAEWEPFEVNMQTLCNSDYSKEIKLSVFYQKGSDHKLIGEATFTVSQLAKRKMKEIVLVNPATKKPHGSIEILQFSLIDKFTFLEYLKGGVRFNVMIGIDFTSSNKDPKNPSSLHALKNDGNLNDYQTAIRDVCEILLCYDYDKKVSVFGFGGKPSWRLGVDHCFALNGDDSNPFVVGMEGIMTAYKKCLNQITLGQPTVFKEILTQGMEFAKTAKGEGSNEYIILLILTDGLIHDMGATIDALAESSHLPLSVIIVGIGNEDFGRMNVLDGDGTDGQLVNSKGETRERDLVQFVAYNEVKSKNKNLAKQILAELPNQFVQYMELVEIEPNTRENYLAEQQQHPTFLPPLELNFAPNLNDFSDSTRAQIEDQLKLQNIFNLQKAETKMPEDEDIAEEYDTHMTELNNYNFSHFYQKKQRAKN